MVDEEQTTVDDSIEEEEEEAKPKEKFNWEAIIVQILNSAADNELSIKRLRKKVSVWLRFYILLSD